MITFDSKSAKPGWTSGIDLFAKAKARTPRLPRHALDRVFEAGAVLGSIARESSRRVCSCCGGSGRMSSRVTCRPCGGSGEL